VRVPLKEGRSLHRTRRFPARFAAGHFRHRAVVGLGGNVGDTAALFDRVVDYMRRDRRMAVVRTSPLLKNPPFGYLEQPDFLNGVMEVATNMKPMALLRRLLWVERRFGRRRTFANAPRTLDLDIIFYDDLRLNSRRLRVPHPHFSERESVMIPLMFLKGDTRA